MPELKREEFLGTQFDVPVCKVGDYIDGEHEYLGWVIDPMTTMRYYVFGNRNELTYVPVIDE